MRSGPRLQRAAAAPGTCSPPEVLSHQPPTEPRSPHGPRLPGTGGCRRGKCVWTARQSKQVICPTLSDRPQKARLSQGSAQRPPATAPSLSVDEIM
ncbi:unnamed protein product [Pleuronectes platessa]|uniref:Uncharacterized protein n=1 Tax=Pleuronectes platessa TaxID=8262 RepID=A0A9N7YV91_PLEPL|nr:unnamed protein product [Pleuronectes platessa]